MSLEDDFHSAMLDIYSRAGEEVGYWARRYLQAVRTHGGLAEAKRILSQGQSGRFAGLDALLEAGRPDLTVEALVLESRFAPLFTAAERKEGARRLGEYGEEAKKRLGGRERLYPDELEPGRKYYEGARKQIRVNAYERNTHARAACLRHHGHRCSVCELSFEERYGDLGNGFIHVHHLKPIASIGEDYALDPLTDLRPVCPNCHAMLHRTEPPMSLDELRERVTRAGRMTRA